MLKNMHHQKRLFQLHTKKTRGVIKITVSDSGPGIPNELMPIITQPYVRGANVKKAGFGLGLSICKKVLRAHGGNIKIANRSSGGSSFILQWDESVLKEKQVAKK